MSIKKNKGTNYIDHRLQGKDMIKHVIVGKECIMVFDINWQLLYVVYNY